MDKQTLLVNAHVSYYFIQEPLVQVNVINFKVQKVKQWEKNLMVKFTSFESVRRRAEIS